MFTISLFTSGPGYNSSAAHLKFRSFFGNYNTVTLDIADKTGVQAISDILEELLGFVDADGDSYILISNDRTKKVTEIKNHYDLEFFVEDTIKSLSLLDDAPEEGNYEDEEGEHIEFLSRMEGLVALADPYDIEDRSVIRDNYKVSHSYGVSNPDIYSSDNTPGSENERNGVGIVNQVDKVSGIAVADRLAKYGVAFPYLSEAQLMADFERLSRMDEVTDSDLVELIKTGFHAIGKTAEFAWDKGEKIAGGLAKKKDDKKKDGGEDKDSKGKENTENGNNAYKKDGEGNGDPNHPNNSNNPDNSNNGNSPINGDDKKDDHKQEIKAAEDEAKDKLKGAKFKGDENIQAARNLASKIASMDNAAGEKLKDEINKKSEDLPSKSDK